MFLRTMGIRRLIATAVATVALAIPASASASPTVVILQDGTDPSSVIQQFSIAPTHVYNGSFKGFSGDLSALTIGLLTSDPRVLMVTADASRSFAPTRFRGARFRGAGSEKTTSTNGDTPIEQYDQFAARGLKRIGGDTSKTAAINGRGANADIDIAIIDSGVQSDHPDLNVAGGVDCTGGSSWEDVEGHGSLVAGVAAAVDNSFGIVGVAPGARIWAVRVLDENLEADDSDILCGIDWVTQNSTTIEVANMSIEGDGESDSDCGQSNSDAIHYAICQSVRSGVTYVAAAGNDSMNVRGFVPAAYPEVIAVSAMVDSDGKKGGRGGPDPCEGFDDDTFAPFSNFGARVDIAAPGVCITSTLSGSDIAADSGTSFAAPFVSGSAALWMTSPAGTSALRNVRASRRAATVKAALLALREQAALAGDPDSRAEGIVRATKI